jgi:hypothetical protein
MKPCWPDGNENEQRASRRNMPNERVSRERYPKRYAHVMFAGHGISEKRKRISIT